jgi:hypothetical protein
VPPALAASTTAAAVALATGIAVTALASVRALALARGLAQPALSAKGKAVCAVLCAALLAGFGGAVASIGNGARHSAPPADRQQVASPTALGPPAADKVDGPKTDQRIEFRDPLLVLHAEVQTELKLTDYQVRKLRNAVGDIDARARVENVPVEPRPPGARAEAANQRTAEMVKALREILPELLTDAQAARLRQLEWQAAGMSAFQVPKSVRLLKLTDDQRAKVQTIVAQARQVPQQRDGRVVDFKYQKADKAAVQQFLELLTEDQRTTWRDLTGKEFDVGSLRPADLFRLPGQRPPVQPGVPSVLPRAPDPDGEHDR